MLGIYVVLDGFDFGVGVVHRYVARTDQERRTVLSAIGPVWDGNEVWLIAAGGVLFMAFPSVYATAFSGFYLALMVVLWLLILRGVAIEFRSHQENPLWREFWDPVFALSSGMLAFVFGAALGNLVRGVPVGPDGLRGMALFTDFRPSKHPGIFDWYTILVGVFAVVALGGHGALYLDWRTTGQVQVRSQRAARWFFSLLAPMWIVVTVATALVQPEIFSNLAARPWFLFFAGLALGGVGGVFYFVKQARPLPAFLSSSIFLLGLLATTMLGNYPNWLRSTIGPEWSLTAANSISSSASLNVAIVWWSLGMALTIAYFGYLFRTMRGKVEVESDGG